MMTLIVMASRRRCGVSRSDSCQHLLDCRRNHFAARAKQQMPCREIGNKIRQPLKSAAVTWDESQRGGADSLPGVPRGGRPQRRLGRVMHAKQQERLERADIGQPVPEGWIGI